MSSGAGVAWVSQVAPSRRDYSRCPPRAQRRCTPNASTWLPQRDRLKTDGLSLGSAGLRPRHSRERREAASPFPTHPQKSRGLAFPHSQAAPLVGGVSDDLQPLIIFCCSVDTLPPLLQLLPLWMHFCLCWRSFPSSSSLSHALLTVQATAAPWSFLSPPGALIASFGPPRSLSKSAFSWRTVDLGSTAASSWKAGKAWWPSAPPVVSVSHGPSVLVCWMTQLDDMAQELYNVQVPF